MKYFLIILFLSTNAVYATLTYAQKTVLSLKMEERSVSEVLDEIERQSEFRFYYNSRLVDTQRKVTVHADKEDVFTVLNQLFFTSNIGYKVVDKDVILVVRNADSTSPQLAVILQGISITGMVTDADGQPLPGVTVMIKGTTRGTATDANGAYSLQVPDENATLTFSFIGYTTQEFIVGNRRTIDVMLSENILQFEEVVVVGYGTMKKRDLTGSVAQMKAGAVANEAPKSLQDVLRANVAGLNIGYSTAAKPGGSLQIRGINSLNAGNSPLIVLDGVIYLGGLEDVNPYDIETIDVLKDASSAAVFGAKSASGVVVITTKKGSSGKPTVNVSSTVGLATMGVQQRVYDGQGYVKWRSDVAKAYNVVNAANNPGMYDDPNNLPPGVTQQQWLSYDTNDGNLLNTWLTRLYLTEIERVNYMNGKEVDWYNAVFGSGFQQDHNISLSGKKDEFTYYWSLGYIDNEGLIYGDNYSNIRSRISIDANVTKFLNVGLTTQFAYRDESAIAAATNIELLSPWGNMYNEDGTYSSYVTDYTGLWNAFYNKSHTDRENKYITLNTSMYAKITLPLGITFQSTFAPRFSFRSYYNHQKSTHIDWGMIGGSSLRQHYNNFEWQVDNTLKWNKTYDIHSFDITLLQNAEKQWYYYTSAANQQFVPNDLLSYHNIRGGTVPSVGSEDQVSTGSAYMARLFYSLMDKYMITGTFRRDGYSAFGQSHPWANFASVALAWRFTDEDFWSGSLKDVLEHGKFRVSYGTNGNRDIGRYAALSDLNSTGRYYLVNAGTGALYQTSQLYANRMNNKDLKWESTASLNFGLDFTFHRQIVDGSIEVYRASTTNLLMNRTLPVMTGFASVMSNMGEVRNNGIEINLNSNNIRTEKLTWRTSFNFSLNKNKIVHLYGTMEDIVDTNGNVIGQKEVDDPENRWFIGRPVGQIWEYEPIAVWQTNEEDEAAKYGALPGDYKLYDPDGNYSLDNSDRQFIGQTTPKFRWNLRNEFTFLRDFNLSFMIYSYWGHKKEYNRAKHNNSGAYSYKDRSSSYILPYWTPENPINTHPRLESRETAAFNVYWDNSFIRLDNISLAYNVPAQWSQKFAIQNLRLFFTIRNAAVWAPKWEFWDPESDGPTPRHITFGLNLTL